MMNRSDATEQFAQDRRDNPTIPHQLDAHVYFWLAKARSYLTQGDNDGNRT